MPLAPLRIGIVAHGGPGGSGTVACSLAHALGCRGHEVHLVTTGRCARLHPKPRLTLHSVEAAPHPMWPTPPWSLALASHLARLARDHGLDLFHAHFAIPYAIAADLARQLLDEPVPLVVTLHGTDVTQLAHEPSYGPLVRLALARAQAITVPSRALALSVAALDPGRPIDIVANFVDADQFRPDPERPEPGAGELVLAHASNFRPVKRAGDAVAIFARVAAAIPARLLLVGDGPDRAAVMAEVQRLGLGDRVEAPGNRDDVECWLRRAHVTLVPSEEESFGLVALESLACATPVVGSRVGGLSEVVKHGETGLLAPAGDVAAMTSHVLALARDGSSWRALSRAAAADARARFSTAAALDAYERIYRLACGDRQPRAVKRVL
jgi:N-acetyl-alpha-D-glucosaminyl L-malate synthase BshA